MRAGYHPASYGGLCVHLHWAVGLLGECVLPQVLGGAEDGARSFVTSIVAATLHQCNVG